MTKTLYGLLLAVEAGEDDGDGDASSLCGLCMDGADVAALVWNVHVFTNLWLFSRLSWYEADGFLRYGGVGKGVTPFGGGDVSHLFIQVLMGEQWLYALCYAAGSGVFEQDAVAPDVHMGEAAVPIFENSGCAAGAGLFP